MENTTKKVLIPAANGSEELELVSIQNILTRAGAEITIAKVDEPGQTSTDLLIQCARGLVIITHKKISECLNSEWDAVIVPGGLPGAEYCGKSEDLITLLKKQRESKKLYGSICATPALVFEPNGLLENEEATCYPCLSGKLTNQAKVNERVVVSNNCVTSQGPSTGIEFALKIAELLFGEEKSNEVKQQILFYHYEK